MTAECRSVLISDMKLCLIVNPNAGKKRGLRAVQDVSVVFKEQNVDFDILISEVPGDSIKLASSLNLSEYNGIIAVGGDGTLFEVINGLFENKVNLEIPIGQIPVGTGNSFIKDLGISTPEDALQAILSGNSRKIDLGEFEYSGGKFYFANLLGTGFVSNVAYRARKYKKLGSLSYIFGVLEEVAVLKASNIELIIDDELIRREAIFVEICNSRYTGGDMMMAPGAKIDDGLLDVIVLNKISRRKLLGLFPSIFKGTHTEDAAVEVFRGKKILLRSDTALALTPDGETFGNTPIDIKMHPGKIKMFC